MIRFVFGRPGGGNTAYIIEQIRAGLHCSSGDNARLIYLIVPEQMAYSAERDVLQALPAEARRQLAVISFSRLCDLVADRYGGRIHQAVSRSMKALLMWQSLREVRGLLETYTQAAGTDGSLCPKMLRAAEELALNDISAERLESASSRLDSDAPLYGKLRDLALVTANYNGLLTEAFGENPADRIQHAAQHIEKHDFFDGAVVYVDGFSSFTVQEYAVLRPLIRQARDVTFSFISNGREAREPQFESTNDTVRRLTRLSEDARQSWEDIRLSDTHRTDAPELLAIEQHIWSFELTEKGRPSLSDDATGRVQIIASPNLYDEAEAAALQIVALAAEGVPYGEIAVVVRDTATWEGVLDAALEQYHIPYFLSTRTDLNEKPAARLILSALRCVARRWQIEDIMTLGKTGLVGISPRELDGFSEYAETWHLTGRRMTDTIWSMHPDGYTTDEMSPRALSILQAANRVREVIMTPLLVLERDLTSAETVTDQCRALYAYLTTLGVKDALSARAESLLRLGQVREAGEEVRLWSFLTETLATVAGVMESAEPLSAEEFGTALSLVFAETDMGSIPARHDCVTVGSASTLRAGGIRAALILGLNEGEFPQNMTDDSLLSEQDKSTLETLGITFDARADRRMADELLYVWRAMTLPSETLILSHSHGSSTGEKHTPSTALTRVKFLLPHVKERSFASSYLQRGVDDRHRTPTEDAISRPTARRMLGEEIWLSQSLLQTFSSCPYRYYGEQLLRLRPRMKAEFSNLSAGNFLHHVLEHYLRRALDENNRIRPMEEEEVLALADAIINDYIDRLCGDISQNGRLLHLFDRLRRVALVLIDTIQAELAQSEFEVAGLEWDTRGRKQGDPQPMCLSLTLDDSAVDDSILQLPAANHSTTMLPVASDPIRILLGGRIDRVDIYRAKDGETVFVRIVDYKASKHSFPIKQLTMSEEDFKSEQKELSKYIDIQLLLYLFTLCSPQNRSLFTARNGQRPTEVRPASAIYLSPDERDRGGAILPTRSGMVLGEKELLAAATADGDVNYLPSVKRDTADNLVGKGLCSREQIEHMQRLLEVLICGVTAEMYTGHAHRTPGKDACKYCHLKEACSLHVPSK